MNELYSRRKAREQEISKKELSVHINAQFILDSSRSGLRVKENLSIGVAEKILKSVFWKNRKFKRKTASKNFFEQESAIN